MIDDLDKKMTLITVSLHDLTVGVRVFDYDDDRSMRSLARNETELATMNLMGFKSANEYIDSYPGKWKENSGVAHRIINDNNLMNDRYFTPLYRYHLCNTSTCDCKFAEMLVVCNGQIVQGMEHGGCLGSMILFPTVAEFQDLVPESMLWFCLDWKEVDVLYE